MPTYYISYGDPPRRRRWVFPVLGVLGLAALLAAVAVVLYSPADDAPPVADGAPPAPLEPSAAAAPAAPPLRAPATEDQWYKAVAAATNKMAYTYYLIDTSESMTRELPNAMVGLSASIAEKAPASQVGIIAFGDICQEVLPLSPLNPDLAEMAVANLSIGMAGKGTDVSCALETALDNLSPYVEQGQATEVVLFSDGSLATVTRSECTGTVVRSDRTLEGRRLSRCNGGTWQHHPEPIISDFADAKIKINGIYFRPNLYDWADQVELLTRETGGEFVRVGRAAR